MAYIGVSPSNGVRRKHTYTATANQTSFSGAGAEGATLSYNDSNYVDVYQNGVKLAEEDYTATSGTAIVLAQGASADDVVEIIAFDVFSVADTVSKSAGGTFDGNVTMAGSFGVTGKTTAPSSPSAGDLWFNSATAVVSTIGPTSMAVYNGSSWDQMSNKFSASGGTETTYASGGFNYKVHTFLSSGSFVADSAGPVDILVVGGGGGTGAGEYHNGGAGAGGVLHATNYTIPLGTYTITVGAGGAGGTQQKAGGGNTNPAPYNNGGDDDPGMHGNPSSFGTIAIALGGGYGGTYDNTNGGHGGSGGGAPGQGNSTNNNYGNSIQTAPTGFTAYGNRGGGKPNTTSYSSGGGGGAGEVGNTNGDCDGGDGRQFDIRNGTNVYYAGGGGGSEDSANLAGAGGAGGGGDGANDHTAQNGTANTGGGAGGGERDGSGPSTNGTIGGSGIVIVRYVV